jgi:hypothetical protein
MENAIPAFYSRMAFYSLLKALDLPAALTTTLDV